MHTDTRIRPEQIADHRQIRRIVAQAFGSDAEADLVERIRESPEFVPEMALVAEVGAGPDASIVGHVMISGAVIRSDEADRRIVMLSPLAVSPEFQRRGIGGALVRAATSLAEQLGERLVVLEGSPKYYSRFGFEPAARYGIAIHLPDWAPPEAAQVMLLGGYDGSEATLRGTVVYPPAFDGVE